MNLKFKINWPLLFSFLIIPGYTFSQVSVLNIKKHAAELVSKGDYSIEQDSFGNANYISSFLNYFADFSKGITVDNGNGQVSQMYATLGCYKNAIDLLDSVPVPSKATISQVNDFLRQYQNQISISNAPISYITDEAKKAPIMMINEAHDFPYHRAFIISLLPALRSVGYKYLAMETLTNIPANTNKDYLQFLSQKTGYYTKEPVFGELVRYALELGYKLVPYEYVPNSFTPINIEDTAQFTRRMHERDSLQALNLIEITKEYRDGKILVIGGYDHTLEAIENTDYFNPFYPMALYFKQMSKIDPLTINQVQYSKSNNGGIGGVVYDRLYKVGKINNLECVCSNDTILKGNLVLKGISDVYTLLPLTKYINGRPTWLELNGLRRRYQFTFPKKVMENTILFQAYYSCEVANQDIINQKVPADQLMLLENNIVDFYLRPRFSYLIVCRDIDNRIIYKKVFHAK